MSVAVRSDPALWARVKQEWLRSEKGGVAGKWNARKAMLAVQEYKQRGGRYVGPRSPANSLKKWEREGWGYIDGDPAGRYLPAAVRAALTPAEKQREKALKRGRVGKIVPYSASVNAKMQRAGIYGSKSRVAKPKTTKPKVAKPKTTKPKVAKPKTTKPKPSKPKLSKPKPSKPKPSKPKATKPKTAKPKPKSRRKVAQR
jgi:hypothetical protein